MMDSPGGIKIPNHWLIDTGDTKYWPYKEGIWVDNETEPFLRLVCVYHGLMDIPEAKGQLTKCNDQFVDEYAEVLLHFFKPIMQKASAGKKLDSLESPFQSDEEAEKATSIYQTWVDTWALGSNKMLEWAMGLNVVITTLEFLGLNRQEMRRMHNRIDELGSKVSPPWVWKTLLSGEYRRLEQAKRELARRTVQSKGFYRLRERTLWTHAYYWIMVRILGYGETELLEVLNLGFDRSNFSGVILKPFDDALLSGGRPKPGRPLGAKTTESMKITRKLLD